MPNIGYATLVIIPTARGISAQVSGQIVAPVAAAGRTAGTQAGAAINSGIASTDYSKSGRSIVGPVAAAGRTAGTQAGSGIQTGVMSADYSRAGSGIVGPVAAAGRTAGTQAGAAINSGIASTDYSKSGSGIGASIMTGFKSVVKTGGVGLALFGGAALKSGLDRLTTIEDATNSLKTIMGDAGKAADLMGKIKETVSGTPFNLDQFATAGKNLVAMNVPAEKVPGYLTAIGEAAAASGKGAEGVNNITTTFGKMAATGKVALDQVWSISEAGVPALQILANGFGVNTTEMQKMISDGAVPAEKAMDLLSKGIMEGSDGAAGATKAYAGTMAGLRTTFSGALGGMKASIARFGAAFLGPFMPLITQTFGNITSGLDGIAPKVNAFSTKLASSDGVKSFVASLATLPETLSRVGTGIQGVWSILSAGDFAGAAKTFGWEEDSSQVNFLFTIREAVTGLVGAFRDGKPTIDAFKGTIGELDTAGAAGSGASGVGSALSSFATGLAGISIGTVTVLGEATGALGTAMGFLAEHSELVVPILIGLAAAYAVGQSATTAFHIATAVRVPAQYAAVAASWAQTRAMAAHTLALNANTVANGGALPVENASAISRMRTAVASGISTAATWVGVTAINAWTFATSGNVIATARATVATIAHTVASKVAQGAMIAWTAAQWLFNAAMSANPLGLVVIAIAALVAGIIIAYKNSETFRNIVHAAFEGIKTAALFLWENVLQPFFSWWMGNLQTAGDVAMWLYNNALKPAFDGIGAAGTWLWDNALKPALTGIVTGIGWVIDKSTEAKEWVTGKFSDLIGFFTGLPDRVRSATAGLFDPIMDSFRAAINWLISKWNNFSLGFDFTIPVVGTNVKFQIDTPDLPLLAGGGIAGRTSAGRLWGPGTPTSDSILGIDAAGIPTALVSTDEGVVHAAAMAAGGDRLVAALNAGWTPSAAALAALFPELNSYATGGKVTRAAFLDQMRGIEGAVYDFGGWGNGWVTDCSGAQAKAANLIAYGDTETGGRFGTGTMATALADRGALPGLGGPDDYSLGWYNGGQWGGHAAGSLPGGTGFEMGGDRGNGQFGGAAKLANASAFTDHAHFPASMFAGGGVSAGTNAATTPPSSTSPSTDTDTSSDTTTSATTVSRLKTFDELGSEFSTIFRDGLLETVGLDGGIWTDPQAWLTGDTGDDVRTTDNQASSSGTNPAAPEAETVAPSSSTGAGTGDANTAVPVDPRSSLKGAALYSYDIARAAQDMGLGEAAAVIGNAVGLVETELKMYANSTVPESLSFPHDAVGSDSDSLGTLQQRGPWGSVADRMSSPISAKLFFNALRDIPDWESMDPGAAAQAVQRSAFPDKYGARLDDARGWVRKAGIFDTGGMLAPGGLAVSMLTKPEPLLPADKWDIAESNIAAVDRLVTAVTAGGGRGSVSRGGDTYNAYGFTAGDIATEWQRRQWARTGGYDGKGW